MSGRQGLSSFGASPPSRASLTCTRQPNTATSYVVLTLVSGGVTILNNGSNTTGRGFGALLPWDGSDILMNKREFDVVIERDREGYFVASVPELAGCHTQAKTLDKLMERIREAIELCLEVQGSDVEPLEFVGLQKISIRA
jgi:predicted RNase H-like HicB family nuclease